MNFIYNIEDATYNLPEAEQGKIATDIKEQYNSLYDARDKQRAEVLEIRKEIFQKEAYIEDENGVKHFTIPELYELYMTFVAHLYAQVAKTPDAMFDCQGDDDKSQASASIQKTMVINALEKTRISRELIKMAGAIADSGEAVLFIGWEKEVKRLRRKKTFVEKFKDEITNVFSSIFGGKEQAQLEINNLLSSPKDIIEYDKLEYEGSKVTCCDNLEFVFDPFKSDDFEKADMIYRKFKTYDDILEEQNFTLSNEAKEELSKIQEDKNKTNDSSEINKDGDNSKTPSGQIELLEFWGNVKITKNNKKVTLKNYLVVVAQGKYVIRFEPNPYIHKPFVYGNILEDPNTRRGVSPLRVARSLNIIASEVLSKELFAFDLVSNPPFLSPKGLLDKDEKVLPGKIIEYKTDGLSPNSRPERMDFSGALRGWDFITFFKGLIENTTGIFKNMVGNVSTSNRTATEIQATVSGSSTRQSMTIDIIYDTIILPMIRKVADNEANFKFEDEKIYQMNPTSNKHEQIIVNQEIRNGNYKYLYNDRKASVERLLKFKDTLAVISQFMQDPLVRERIDGIELFKMALEQQGFENISRIILDDQEEMDTKIKKIEKEMAINNYVENKANTVNQGFNGMQSMARPQELPPNVDNGFNQQSPEPGIPEGLQAGL